MTSTDSRAEGSDTAFRLAVGLYVGVLLAASGSTTLAALSSPTVLELAAVTVTAFVIGALAGVALSRAANLPARLGRSRGRRFSLVAPAGAFAVVGFVPSAGGGFRTAVLASAVAIATVGFLLSKLAQRRHLESTLPDEPNAIYAWRPPGSPRLDALVAGAGLLGGVGYALAGSPRLALWWLFFGLFWLGAAFLEGRLPAGARETCELRVYDAGLVRVRPHAKSFVPWDDVDHVRLRDGELVFDRGLFDLSFDCDELEDPDAVLSAVERVHPGPVLR
ncbi:hypothetical protein [Natrononativus amylolyticus]|uniref:hypothetical protein n=1 Tax=Natrononativus amylolyticus TaxID=2963434 RepID=UPI0020CBDF27|nr:hypothetical protein [Natrononativus amylolyticus]